MGISNCLRGMETLRIFGRGEAEIESIRSASEDFRQRTMEVLRLAFLSSGILEFFTSLSIALVAVYFGFSYLGELDFGHYDTGVTLAAGSGPDPCARVFPAIARSRYVLSC